MATGVKYLQLGDKEKESLTSPDRQKHKLACREALCPKMGLSSGISMWTCQLSQAWCYLELLPSFITGKP